MCDAARPSWQAGAVQSEERCAALRTVRRRQRPGGSPAAAQHVAHCHQPPLGNPLSCVSSFLPLAVLSASGPLTVSHPTSLCACREPEAEAKAEAEQNIESVEQAEAEQTAAAVEAEEEEKVGEGRWLCCCGDEQGAVAAGHCVIWAVRLSCAPANTCIFFQQALTRPARVSPSFSCCSK